MARPKNKPKPKRDKVNGLMLTSAKERVQAMLRQYRKEVSKAQSKMTEAII